MFSDCGDTDNDTILLAYTVMKTITWSPVARREPTVRGHL